LAQRRDSPQVGQHQIKAITFFSIISREFLMANTQGMCNSFKRELLVGIHAFGPGTGVPERTAATPDVINGALFLVTAERNASNTVYNNTGELAGTGNYTQGGIAVTMANAPVLTSTVGHFTPSASLVWANLTSSGAFDCLVLYNTSQGDKQISVHTFSSQSITAGTLTLTMPTDDNSTALIRIA
jgi:hypothetical protein